MIPEMEKGYTHWYLECKDRPLTSKSIVCLSPYNVETYEWLMGLNFVTIMEEALTVPLVCDSSDGELCMFIEKNKAKGITNEELWNRRRIRQFMDG